MVLEDSDGRRGKKKHVLLRQTQGPRNKHPNPAVREKLRTIRLSERRGEDEKRKRSEPKHPGPVSRDQVPQGPEKNTLSCTQKRRPGRGGKGGRIRAIRGGEGMALGRGNANSRENVRRR